MDIEDMIAAYNDSALEYARSSVGHEDKAKLSQFSRLLGPQAKVLDVGCAAGRDSKLLSDMGLKVTGVDLADKLLDIAQSSYPAIRFLHADIRKLPFEAGSFEGVWASAVLHHLNISDIPRALAECNRVLIPGGILYITTKAGEGILTSREQSVGGRQRSFTLLGLDELHKMLQTAGFSAIEREEKASRSRKNLAWLKILYQKNASQLR